MKVIRPGHFTYKVTKESFPRPIRWVKKPPYPLRVKSADLRPDVQNARPTGYFEIQAKLPMYLAYVLTSPYIVKYDNFLKSEGLTFRAADPKEPQPFFENETSLNLQTNNV